MGSEERLYARFPINSERIGFVTIHGVKTGIIKEISYGGLSLQPTITDAELAKLLSQGRDNPLDEPLEVHLLGRTFRCNATRRYQLGGITGYRFNHEQAHIFQFLREFIDPLKYGAALCYLEKNQIDDLTELPITLFTESIPIEFDVSGFDEKNIPNVELTIQQDRVLYQFIRQDNELKTLHNVWPGAVPGELRATEQLDAYIVRYAVAFLLGYLEADLVTPFGKLVEFILDRVQFDAHSANLLQIKKTA